MTCQPSGRTLNLMSSLKKFNVSESGFAPIVLIIILVVAITGVAGVVYSAKKEIKVRSDKTTETSELKGSPIPTPEDKVVTLANSGKLADKPFEFKADQAGAASPEFSITSPMGWEQLPPSRNIVVEFLSPAKDVIEEGMAFIDIQPNITVFVAKGDFKSLEEANNAFSSKNSAASGKQKAVINGQEVLVIEATQDVADLLRDTLEAQIKEEIAKSGTKVSETEVREDVNKVLQQAKVKVISYSFYKDGYYINVAGKALESFWDKRGPQLKKSMDTFKFE